MLWLSSKQCHLWPVCLGHIFPHYLINCVIFGNHLLNIKWVFWFSLQLLSETHLIPGIIQPDVINVHRRLHVKCTLFLSDSKWNMNFYNRFSKKPQISNLMKVCPVGAELFHTGRQTVRHGSSGRDFLQFSNAPKKFYELYSFACMVINTAECSTQKWK